MAVDTNFNVKVRIDPEDFPSTDQAVIWDTSSGSFALTSSIGGGIEQVQNPEDNRILTTNNDGSEIWAESYFRWVNDTSVSGSSPGKLIIGNTTETGDQIVHIRNQGTSVEYHQTLISYESVLGSQTLLRTGLESNKKVVIGFGGAAQPDLHIGEYTSNTDSTINSHMVVTYDGDVGIGNTSPTKRLQVTDSVLTYTADITSTNTTSSNTNKVLKLVSGVPLSDLSATANNNVRFIEFFVENGAELIGILRAQPGNTFNPSPTVILTSASDKRLKENIKPLSLGIDTLLKIEPVEYTWKKNKSPGKGFIAQDLHKVYPEAAFKPQIDDIKKDPWTIDQTQLIPLLVKSIQDQQKIIDELKEKVTNLENKLK